MGADLYQRRSAARVTFTPASHLYGQRRRRQGAPRRDLLVLVASLAMLAGAIWTAMHINGGGRAAGPPPRAPPRPRARPPPPPARAPHPPHRPRPAPHPHP